MSAVAVLKYGVKPVSDFQRVSSYKGYRDCTIFKLKENITFMM